MPGHAAIPTPADIESVQRKLRWLELYRGPCDGVWTLVLDSAIRNFQRGHGLGTEHGCDGRTLEALKHAAGLTFQDVLDEERLALELARRRANRRRGVPVPREREQEAARRRAQAGLALSGGGVRSATFNLGILQAMARAGLLQKFDYLSTVSGGGYIGSWLSRWIAVHAAGGKGVEDALAGRRDVRGEPDQLKFLRQYSNYLTPQVGMFSADTWTVLATYLRNAMLNLLPLCAALAFLLTAPRFWVLAVEHWRAGHAAAFGRVAGVGLLVAILAIAHSIARKPDRGQKSEQGQGWVLWTIAVPLAVAATTGSVWLWHFRNAIASPWAVLQNSGFSPAALIEYAALQAPPENADQWLLVLFGPACLIAWGAGWLVARRMNRRPGTPPTALLHSLRVHRRILLGHFVAVVLTLALGSTLAVASAVWLDENDSSLLVVVAWLDSFGPAYTLGMFTVASMLMIGLVGRLYSDTSREWWSRQNAWVLIFAVAMTSLFLFSLYSPAVAVWAFNHAGAWGRSLVGAGWLGTLWASLWAARHPAVGQPGLGRYLALLALCGPPLAAALILTLVATSIQLLITPNTILGADAPFRAILDAQLLDATRTVPSRLAVGALIAVLLFGLFALRLDVNKFSLYMMHRNRLVRAYLGAVNPQRTPDPFTGFCRTDDVALASVGGRRGKPQRPYHILNAALNLVKGKELAWQTRKSASFAFTPRYCGFEMPAMPGATRPCAPDESLRGRYRPTADCAADSKDAEDTDRGVKLGMAMAVSGAAATPSMGVHSAPALTFLMTLFNVRLGRWWGNPIRKTEWRRASPRWGFMYLIRELLGLTDACSPFLYLSDGGHFENLGIYELVRRRCRLIVAVDATADRELHFGDLGNAVRKCLTDFNVEIDINIRQLERRSGSDYSSGYCVAGKILYDRNNPQRNGTLLYIKPSLIGTEYAELYNYSHIFRDFPHQSAADQWFDETQFESYRGLGLHIGGAIFARLPAGQEPCGSAADIERICHAIERNWWRPEPEQPGTEPVGPRPAHPHRLRVVRR